MLCHAVLCCRHQWYQLGNKVVIDVYAKNLPKDAVTVQLSGEDDKLNISIKAQPSSTAAAAVEEDYVLDLHLSDKVGCGVRMAQVSDAFVSMLGRERGT
jgi:hypothetical protein